LDSTEVKLPALCDGTGPTFSEPEDVMKILCIRICPSLQLKQLQGLARNGRVQVVF
jgi:hypothetical protein